MTLWSQYLGIISSLWVAKPIYTGNKKGGHQTNYQPNPFFHFCNHIDPKQCTRINGQTLMLLVGFLSLGQKLIGWSSSFFPLSPCKVGWVEKFCFCLLCFCLLCLNTTGCFHESKKIAWNDDDGIFSAYQIFLMIEHYFYTHIRVK